MKFYWKMPQSLRPHYQNELKEYQINLSQNNLALAWRHLERAHILGQPWAVEHSEVHWLMLEFGFKIKRVHGVELFGCNERVWIYSSCNVKH